jgi:hypothetical protein
LKKKINPPLEDYIWAFEFLVKARSGVYYMDEETYQRTDSHISLPSWYNMKKKNDPVKCNIATYYVLKKKIAKVSSYYILYIYYFNITNPLSFILLIYR